MLTLLSPAKKLLPFTKPYSHDTSEPVLIKNAIKLAKLMKTKTGEQLANLMDLSRALAVLNYERYQNFSLKADVVSKTYPALFLFQGDVYQGLEAATWEKKDITFSQKHLGILSGLYGLLKPLDRIQPYRLEMGVRLNNPCGETLYNFWQDALTKELNTHLNDHKNPILINLASTEYFKVVDRKILKYPVVTINFYEQKNNQIKMIGIYAKKARGRMAKFIMQHQIDDLGQITQFRELGYEFDKKTSSETEINFVRSH